MRLSELEPQFMRYETSDHQYLRQVDSLAEAQGIQFLCPVCFAAHNGPIGTHYIEVSFANKGVLDHQGSHNREGNPSRWSVAGSGYSDLTTTPSILIDPAKPACEGWHGFITDGEVK
jgi:hypothetical protein